MLFDALLRFHAAFIKSRREMDISEISLLNKRKSDEDYQYSDVIPGTPLPILKKSRLSAVIVKDRTKVVMAHILQSNETQDVAQTVFGTDSEEMDDLFKDIDFSEKFTKPVKHSAHHLEEYYIML